MLQQKLGRRIADLRKARRLTQVQLARAVGCSTEFTSLVERGVNSPSVARLEDFARALKVQVVVNRVCEWGQMFERLIYDRSKAVFEYFRLPFEAPPPPARAKP